MRFRVTEKGDNGLSDRLHHIQISHLYVVEDTDSKEQFLMIALWDKQGAEIKVPLENGLSSVSVIKPGEFELID